MIERFDEKRTREVEFFDDFIAPRFRASEAAIELYDQLAQKAEQPKQKPSDADTRKIMLGCY